MFKTVTSFACSFCILHSTFYVVVSFRVVWMFWTEEKQKLFCCKRKKNSIFLSFLLFFLCVHFEIAGNRLVPNGIEVPLQSLRMPRSNIFFRELYALAQQLSHLSDCVTLLPVQCFQAVSSSSLWSSYLPLLRFSIFYIFIRCVVLCCRTSTKENECWIVAFSFTII